MKKSILILFALGACAKPEFLPYTGNLAPQVGEGGILENSAKGIDLYSQGQLPSGKTCYLKGQTKWKQTEDAGSVERADISDVAELAKSNGGNTLQISRQEKQVSGTDSTGMGVGFRIGMIPLSTGGGSSSYNYTVITTYNIFDCK